MSNTKPPDELGELFARAQAGDPNARRELFEILHKRLRGLTATFLKRFPLVH